MEATQVLDKQHQFDINHILLILSDSALPTGGFVSSSGLEAYLQSGYLKEESIEQYLKKSAYNYAYSSLPYVLEVYKLMKLNEKDLLNKIIELDDLYHVSNLNSILRRSSKALGMGLLILYLKSFDNGQHPCIIEFKNKVRQKLAHAHFPICFAMLMAALNIEEELLPQLYLFQYLRSIVSAAVRLNIVGPYQAQAILLNFKKFIYDLSNDTNLLNLKPQDAYQSVPILDIVQSLHDNLYSRIFNS